MKFFHLIWSNLKRRKLRTLLTLLSIFVAFLLYGMLCAVKEAFTGGVKMAGADRLIVRHKVSLIMSIPASYGPRMEQIPGVASVFHFTWFNGIYKDEPKNFFASFPVSDFEKMLETYPEYTVPKEQLETYKKTRSGAIAGRSLTTRKEFGWKIGDRVAMKSPIWPKKGEESWEFEVVGILDATKKTADTSGFYFRYDYFDEARSRGDGMVTWYVVRVSDPNRAGDVAKAIDNEFENSPYETKAEPEGAFAQGFVQQVGNIGKILIYILSAVFFTILLVAGNTMAQSVRERVEEIGVLKAMGFTNQTTLILVLAESIMIAGIGGFGGLGMALGIAARGSPVPSMLPVFYLPGESVVIGVIMVILLGVIAGILPALQAMNLRIADALRRQG